MKIYFPISMARCKKDVTPLELRLPCTDPSIWDYTGPSYEMASRNKRMYTYSVTLWRVEDTDHTMYAHRILHTSSFVSILEKNCCVLRGSTLIQKSMMQSIVARYKSISQNVIKCWFVLYLFNKESNFNKFHFVSQKWNQHDEARCQFWTKISDCFELGEIT